MPDKVWKSVERRLAKDLNGQRNPVNGRGDQPDVTAPGLVAEVKVRRRLPAWIARALAQAHGARRGSALAVAILHQHAEPHGRDVVLMTFADFRDWFGDLPPKKPEAAT